MISLLNPPVPAKIAEEDGEFEIVMGRRQIASVSLVVIVLLAVCSGVSYLIGKTAEAKGDPTQPAQAPSAQDSELPAAQTGAPQAGVPAVYRSDPAMGADAAGGPLFADPVPGAVYIQVGAVEKGVAEIWVEGLRTHGLHAFVAPGLSDRIYRVLVGPLPSPDAYQDAKDSLDRIGLATFGRKYQL